MLTAAAGLVALAGAHPILKEAKELLEKEWIPDEPPRTVVSSELAKALLPHVDAMTDKELQSIFACVEHILSAGDDMAKDVVSTGFLEAIVTAAETNKAGSARLLAFLGPLAFAYCEEWKAFTGR